MLRGVSAPKPFDLCWRLARILGATLLAVVLLPLAFYGLLHVDHNRHEVQPGVLYRSAQLPVNEFVGLAKSVGLRTVINLRGENSGRDWYDAQYQAARSLGVGFINYRMSASKELTPAQMTELARILRDAPKPVLIHCGSGSDRTGLACALYLFDAGHPPEAVADQLSLRFGHFPYLWSGSWAMDNSLKAYAEYLRASRRDLAATAN
jgi:protein tyrosine/serine phosphatase